MAPWARSGDYLVLGAFRPGRARPGQVVVAVHPRFGTIVKRIAKVESDGALRLCGDAPASIGPLDIGLVPVERVLGRVLARIRSPGSTGRPRRERSGEWPGVT